MYLVPGTRQGYKKDAFVTLQTHTRGIQTQAYDISCFTDVFTDVSTEKHNRPSKVVVQGLVFLAHPLYVHTYVHRMSTHWSYMYVEFWGTEHTYLLSL
jgi:hypothetical protein